jgi:hypothetical protein
MHFMTMDFRLIALVPKLWGGLSGLRNVAANSCGFCFEIWINRMTTRPSESKSRTCVQNIERPMNTYRDRITLGLIWWSLNFQQLLRCVCTLHLLVRSKVQVRRLSPNHSVVMASLPISMNDLQHHAHCTRANASYRVAKTWSYSWVELHWPSNWSSRIRPCIEPTTTAIQKFSLKPNQIPMPWISYVHVQTLTHISFRHESVSWRMIGALPRNRIESSLLENIHS